MTHRFFNICLVFFISMQVCFADDIIPVILEGDNNTQSETLNNPIPKMPPRPVLLNVSGHSISWDNSILFEEIQVVVSDLETIVYSSSVEISSNEVILPSFLEGDFIIRLCNGNVWYRGNITL